MKLTKAKLTAGIREKLTALGYYYLKDSITVADGLYGKVVEGGFYLTLGMTISNYNEGEFTGAFYLSKGTVWGAVWGDIPKNSYKRVGFFLTNDERSELLSLEYSKEGVRDAWWNYFNEGISNFIKCVELTENRFLSQNCLKTQIQKSSDVNKMAHLSRLLEYQIKIDSLQDEFTYRFIPQKEIDDIPIPWFKAAERILSQENSSLNVNTVKRLAADAWRQNYLRNIDL